MENKEKRPYTEIGRESVVDPRGYKNRWKKQKEDRIRLRKIKEALKPINQLLKNLR